MITLHWAIAALVSYSFWVGPGVYGLDPSEKSLKMAVHGAIGGVIFVLMLIRLWLRIKAGTPAKIPRTPVFIQYSARFLHWTFYILLVLQPIIGALTAAFIDYNVVLFGVLNISGFTHANMELSDAFHAVHTNITIALYWLIYVHVAAALAHILFWRDGVFSSMTPRIGR